MNKFIEWTYDVKTPRPVGGPIRGWKNGLRGYVRLVKVRLGYVFKMSWISDDAIDIIRHSLFNFVKVILCNFKQGVIQQH